MASNTSHYNMVKPAYDEAADVAVINSNMDIIDGQMYKNEQGVTSLQDGMAIVANGNTHAAISAGQFVYVKNHDTLNDGLYTANSNIAANATLSTSNLTADSSGGLNALNSKIANLVKVKTFTKTTDSSGGFALFSVASDKYPNNVLLGVVLNYPNVATPCYYHGNQSYIAYAREATDNTVVANTEISGRFMYIGDTIT